MKKRAVRRLCAAKFDGHSCALAVPGKAYSRYPGLSMCGIAGFFGEIARTRDAASRLSAMSAALAHRGPDGQGCWLGRDVGLGLTRLAIIDLAGGSQPMWSTCGNHVVVFNGEIYNHAEIRQRLSG